jgi:hypothetical protein
MNRRNFMAGILAACAAPAIVRVESLMVVNPTIIVPPVWRTGEIGHIEGFRFILTPEESPLIRMATREILRHYAWTPAAPIKPGRKLRIRKPAFYAPSSILGSIK